MKARGFRIGTLVLSVCALMVACGSDRPREQSVSDVEPCDLIPQAEFQRLHIRSAQPLDFIPGSDREGISCIYQVYGEPDDYGTNSVYVGGITNHGIDKWTSGEMESSTAEDVARIHGFRTVNVWQLSPPGPDDVCTLYVDVADDQSLVVEISYGRQNGAPPNCETARQIAETAMTTLTRTQ